MIQPDPNLTPKAPLAPRNQPPLALKISLGFWVGFMVLGYPLSLSTILGGISLIAGLWIQKAWNSIYSQGQVSPQIEEELTLISQLNQEEHEAWRATEKSQMNLNQNLPHQTTAQMLQNLSRRFFEP